MVVSSGRIGLAGWPRANRPGPAGCRLACRGPAELSQVPAGAGPPVQPDQRQGRRPVTGQNGGSSVNPPSPADPPRRSEEYTSELQSQSNLVCRLLLEKKQDRLR